MVNDMVNDSFLSLHKKIMLLLYKICVIICLLDKVGDNVDYNIPDYYRYLNWYDLYTPIGLYNFMQEFINENNLNDYPDIKTYYNMLCKSAFSDNPDMVVVEFIMNKLRNRLIKYQFAHSTYIMQRELKNKNLYFYWKPK